LCNSSNSTQISLTANRFYRCFCVDASYPGHPDPNPSCSTCWTWIPDYSLNDPRIFNQNGIFPLEGPLGTNFKDPQPPNVSSSGKCGVNPVTGQPGIRDDKPVNGLRAGGTGNIRPGNGGNGGFRSRGGGTKHDGTDIAAPVGTPIVASMGGTVVKTVTGFGLANTAAERSAQNGGYGNAVTIKYDNGAYGYYAHLTNVYVAEGNRVEQGATVIGTAGRTGNANNSQQPSQDDHLHYGRFSGPANGSGRPANKNQYVDPVKSLNSPCS
jgi:murein DD-endopeptidase MepM/ murein hydrolase activator NlpD